MYQPIQYLIDLVLINFFSLPDIYINFLISYLEPRMVKVTCEGVVSDIFELSNIVFQGTVLGPPMWNIFFADGTS